MRLGLLGGTFDPIHRGHLDAAHAAQRELKLDRVWFIPANIPPHRTRAPVASGFHRFAMTAIAVLGEPTFAVSDLELTREGPSFSADTIRALRNRGWQASQLFFITGVDAFAEIETWRDFPDFLDESHFVVVTRPGHSAHQLRTRLPDLSSRLVETGDAAGSRVAPLDGPGTVIALVDAQTTNISSTEVRRRSALADSLIDVVPEGVARYIKQHQLYDSIPAASQLHDRI